MAEPEKQELHPHRREQDLPIAFPDRRTKVPHPSSCFICQQTTYSLGLITLAQCPSCGNYYCPKDASHINQEFCINCCKDITITDKTYNKTEIEYDESTDETIITHRGCRRIRLNGADWVFYSRAIHEMTEDEQLKSIEFHRAAVSALEIELTQHKIEKRLESYKTNSTFRSTAAPAKATTPKEPKKKVQKPEDLKKMAESLAKMGLTPEMAAMIFGFNLGQAVAMPSPLAKPEKEEETL